MVWLALIGGLVLFMGLIGGAHALDRYAEERFGYRPFALPNLAFMLIPHGVLAAWAGGWSRAPWPPLTPALGWALVALGGAALVFMLIILRRRTSLGIAAVAAGLMLIAAPVLVLSVLFRELADLPRGQ